MAKNDKLNEIMIQLAVIDEKLDSIRQDLDEVDELSDRVESLEQFKAYVKGGTVVSLAGLTTAVAVMLEYVSNLWR